MKHLYVYFTLFFLVIFSVNSWGQTDFNTSISLVEQALRNKDLSKAKNILSAEPLQSNQSNKQVQELNIKLSFLEKLIEGNNLLNSKKWDDAIIAAERGLNIIQTNKKLFKGTEKQDLEKIISDAENGKKGIFINNNSSSTNSSSVQGAYKLDDIGDPIDYKTGISQINKAYEDEKNAPFKEFEAKKDTMNQESEKRIKKIGDDVVLNLKLIDSAQVKMDNEKERVIKSIDSNRTEYQKERDKVIESKNKQTNEMAVYVQRSIEKTDSSVAIINETNEKRIDQIIKNIDTLQKQTSFVKSEIQKENDKRIETIGKNQKSDDSLRYVVRTSMNDMTDENAKSVADNTKKMDEYRQTPPPVTKGSGITNSKGVPYPVGITQGVFSKGEAGKPQVLITRRVKVDENNNYDVYIKQESPKSLTTYTKNGTTVTEYQWNVESGNVTNFE
ncbi:MAG: hypothetical protein ACKO7P_06870 [Bacteroidota bacterium]